MYPSYDSLASILTIFGIIVLFFIVFIVLLFCWALCIRDSTLADDANEYNMVALQFMRIPNRNALRAGQND